MKMTPELKKKVHVTTSLLVFGLLSWFVIWSLISLGSKILQLDAKVAGSIIGAMATVLVGVAAVVWTQRQIKIREIAETHRPKKVEIYQLFIEVITSHIANANDNISQRGMSEQEVIDNLFKFKKELLLWGSPKVIKALNNFDREAAKGNIQVFEAVDLLYKAIREDIGLDNRGLKSLELATMFVNDKETYLKDYKK